MKLAPLFRAFSGHQEFEASLVHTGQHYDDQMSGAFFRDLGLPAPRYNLEVGSGTHAQQTAEIMKRFEPVMLAEQPKAVLVVGDVNSTAACALVAKKLNTTVIHVEAGLRSFDRAMPEEINRLVTDAISDLLLVTEKSGLDNLAKEGVEPERVRYVGNLMIDSLFFHLKSAAASTVLPKLDLQGRRFGLITLHRPSNVDDPSQLKELLRALRVVSADLPLYFPVHPRTRSRLGDELAGDNIHLLEPQGYLDFVCLMSHSSVVFTDSGGIQEETTALRIPCVTLRENTERPITVAEGTNRLAGTSFGGIIRAWEDVKSAPGKGTIPEFWDGKAAGRCVEEIRQFLVSYGHP